MTSTAPITSVDLTPTSFAYIDCDIPEGQTLVEWRRQRYIARDAERHGVRRLRLPRLRLIWWTA